MDKSTGCHTVGYTFSCLVNRVPEMWILNDDGVARSRNAVRLKLLAVIEDGQAVAVRERES